MYDQKNSQYIINGFNLLIACWRLQSLNQHECFNPLMGTLKQ